jgi:hypothetical protein
MKYPPNRIIGRRAMTSPAGDELTFVGDEGLKNQAGRNFVAPSWAKRFHRGGEWRYYSPSQFRSAGKFL